MGKNSKTVIEAAVGKTAAREAGRGRIIGQWFAGRVDGIDAVRIAPWVLKGRQRIWKLMDQPDWPAHDRFA